MELIITDVTAMKDAKRCIAGWCPAERRMVRPLSGRGQYWPSNAYPMESFRVGNVVRVTPTGEQSDRGLPHSREDTIISRDVTLIAAHVGSHLLLAVKGSEAPSINDLFNGAIHRGQSRDRKFVAAGTDCPSLGAISSERLGFDEDDGRLRCWLYDSRGERYKFAVVGIDLLNRYESEGLEALNRAVRRRGPYHVRLGLAHPYPDGNCTVMVNNILFP